jgi:hypothetical protein
VAGGDLGSQLAWTGKAAVEANDEEGEESGGEHRNRQVRQTAEHQKPAQGDKQQGEVRTVARNQEIGGESHDRGHGQRQQGRSDEVSDDPQGDLAAARDRGLLAGAKRLPAAHVLKQHHWHGQHPARDPRDHHQRHCRQQDAGTDDRDGEFGRLAGQVVVDVVASQKQPVKGCHTRQKRQRDHQQPDQREARETQEMCSSPERVEESLHPGHPPVLERAETDDHQLARLGEENTQRHGAHHHQRRQTGGMEQKRHDGLIGDHTGRRRCEKELEEQPDEWHEDRHCEPTREKIGEEELRPDAPEFVQRVGQDGQFRQVHGGPRIGPHRETSEHPPPGGTAAGSVQFVAGFSLSMTWSIVKLAGVWRGGNSLKVARNSATNA